MLMYLRTASKYKPPEGLVIIIWRFLHLEFMGLVIRGVVKKRRENMRNFTVEQASSAEEYVRSIHNWGWMYF